MSLHKHTEVVHLSLRQPETIQAGNLTPLRFNLCYSALSLYQISVYVIENNQ